MIEIAGFMTKDPDNEKVRLYDTDLRSPLIVPKGRIESIRPLLGAVMTVKSAGGHVEMRGFLKQYDAESPAIELYQSDLTVPPQDILVSNIASIEFLTAVRLVLGAPAESAAGEAGFLGGPLASTYLPGALPSNPDAATTPPSAVDYVLCVATNIRQIGE